MKKITNSGYIMSNSVNYKAFLIQTLVHNYLYDKYKDKVDNVWLYDEIINDIDIIQNNPLPDDIIHDKQNKLTIESFFTFLDTNDINYLESIDVKYSKQLSFGNLKQILLKCVYPCNTKLKLILVPSINYKHVDDTLTNYINSFIELQQGILVLNNDIKFKLYNNFINVSNYDYIDINTALETFLDKLINSKLKTDYKNNITMDDYNTFDTNFKNLSIEYITINDLLSKPIHKYVFGEALGYYINDDNKDDNVNKHKMIMDKLKQFK